MDKLSTRFELSKVAVIAALAAAALSSCASHESVVAQHDEAQSTAISYEVTSTEDGQVMCLYGLDPAKGDRTHIVAEGDTIGGFLAQYPEIGKPGMSSGLALNAPTYDQVVKAIESHNNVKAEELQIGDAVQLPLSCQGVAPRH